MKGEHMKFDGQLNIISKRWLTEDVFQLTLERTKDIGDINAGQFFNIKTTPYGSPLLRRPISVSEATEHHIVFTIKCLGEGTTQMSQMLEGSALTLMGPLGNGFSVSQHTRVLIVGGGIGVAPLLGLLQMNQGAFLEADVVLGFKDQPYLIENFKDYVSKAVIVSELDTQYRIGYVTEPLKEMIASKSYDMIYACGPLVMLKSVSKIVNEANIPTQLLMEEKMACGIGACLVCTCKTKRGDFGFEHSRMCKEGPMFFASEVIFDED